MTIDFGAAMNPPEIEETLPAQSVRTPIEKIKADLSEYDALIAEMVETADALEVKSPETNAQASEMTVKARKIYKRIDDIKKDATKPHRDFTSAVNAMAKVYLDQFEKIGKGLGIKISRYSTYQENERRRAEAEARKRVEAEQKRLDAEAKKDGYEPVKVEAPVLPDPPKVTYTDAGSVYQRKDWVHEITDANKIPREYLMPNEKKIKDAIKAGVRAIPGVNIFEQSTTVTRG